MMIYTSWEIKVWVEDALPEIARRCDINWSEAHFDRTGREYRDFNNRDLTEWVMYDEAEQIINKFFENREQNDLRDALLKELRKS